MMLPDGPSDLDAAKDIFKATLSDIRELTTGHHSALLSTGTDPELAHSMALQLHAHLLNLAFSAKTNR